MGLLTKVWNGLRKLVGLVLPIFKKRHDFPGLGRAVLWTIHFVLLALVLVGLYFLGKKLDLLTVLRQRAPGWLQPIWLPVLFLLIYALSWLGWLLYRLLFGEGEASDFPDIDEAWDEAVLALNRAGIELTELPLFLLLGRPVGGDNALLKAAQVDLRVQRTPAGDAAPLHVYAGGDGIFVTCAGASLLGRYATMLAQGGGPAEPAAMDGTAPAGDLTEDDLYKSMGPRGFHQDIQEILAKAREQGRGPGQLTADEQRQIRLLMGVEEVEHLQKQVKPRPSLLKNPAEAELWAARLKHLCRLIARDRQPYCPLNGMMVLVPLAATDSDDDANQAYTICQHDLAAARQALQMHFPKVAVVCDLETAPGFAEFLGALPGNEIRKKRLGQGFPLVPDLKPDAVAETLEGLSSWLCHGVVGNWVTKLFKVESAGPQLADAVRTNTQLFHLFDQLRERHPRFARIFSRGMASHGDGPPLLSGCYLAATGGDPVRQSAFVPGLFRKLTKDQSSVAWTDTAKDEDANFHRWATYGYAAIAAVTAVLAALWFFLRDSKP